MDVQKQTKQRLELTLCACFLGKIFSDRVIYLTQFLQGYRDCAFLSINQDAQTNCPRTWRNQLLVTDGPRSFIRSKSDAKYVCDMRNAEPNIVINIIYDPEASLQII